MLDIIKEHTDKWKNWVYRLPDEDLMWLALDIHYGWIRLSNWRFDVVRREFEARGLIFKY